MGERDIIGECDSIGVSVTMGCCEATGFCGVVGFCGVIGGCDECEKSCASLVAISFANDSWKSLFSHFVPDWQPTLKYLFFWHLDILFTVKLKINRL